MFLKSHISLHGTASAPARRVAMLTALGFDTRCLEWPGSQEPQSRRDHRDLKSQGNLIPTV